MPARARVAVLAASLLAAMAGAQIPSATGNVYGAASDEQGRPIVGAVVTLAGPDPARNATTNERGYFRFVALAPGVYAVELERAGFRSVRREVTVSLRK